MITDGTAMIEPFYRILRFLVGFWTVVALAAPVAAESPSPRSLPSLVTDWRWDGEAELMEVDGDEIVVLGGGRVTVLDAGTGEVRWQRTLCDGESRLANGLVVTAGRVVAACDARLAVLDRQDGEIVARHELRVFRLVGPPPVARIYHGESAEELVAVDPESGAVSGRWLAAASFSGLAASAGEPESEDERIVHAIFEQFFLFHGDSGALAVVESDRALEWCGRRGPTLTLDPEDAEEFRRRAGLDGITYVDIVPVTADDEEAEEFWGTVELEPGERRYALTLYRGMLNAEGYLVLVRRAGERWVVTRLEMAWIS